MSTDIDDKEQARALRKVVIASLIGATIEWYDFFLYGIIAGTVFNQLYFPSDSAAVSLMLAYATFAVGFVARPVGGVVFGHFGDRVGRKSMLVITLMLMGTATFLIGVLPTHASIGIWAPALLLLLRIAQGLGVGGEWGGSVLMTFEYAKKHKRGLYGSLPQIGLAIGLCLGSGVVGLLSWLLTEPQFMAWGWRVAFLISATLIGIGLYIRLRIMETPEFAQVKSDSKELRLPFVDMLRRAPKNVVLGMGARYIDGVIFNIYAVFAIAYLTSNLDFTRTTALTGVFAAAVTMIFFIPIFGALSDRYGRRLVYGVGSVACGLLCFVSFWVYMNAEASIWIWLATVIPFGIVYAAVYGPEAALFCELFDTDIRYSGISFVYQFSGIFASGMTPIIATALLSLGYGEPWLVALYTLGVSIVSMLSVYLMREVVVRRKTASNWVRARPV